MSIALEQNPLQLFCHWITRLAWVNFLVVLFTLLGGVVFGLTAALSAGHSAMTRYITGSHKVPVKTFYQDFKANLKVATLVGNGLLLLAFSLAWYAMTLIEQQNPVLIVLGLSLLPLTLLVVMVYLALIVAGEHQLSSYLTTLKLALHLTICAWYIPVGFVLSLALCVAVYALYPIVGVMFFIAPPLLMTSLLYHFKFMED
ncbi:DUF624 domain-containing protein [Vibrio sp. WXL210]|uniref:DUF624 domain-containing protein n=1 Tax=Vibrio sp. WXL210 TaxID=3450709 RepID=UPI003EC51A26